MPDQYITCPKCGNKIQLTEAFTQEIEEKLRAQYESEIKKKDKELERALGAKEKEYEEKLAHERAKLETQARKQVEESVSVEMKDLHEQLEEKSKQLETSRKQELDLRKRQRELEEREQNLKLEVARQLDDERKKIWEDATKKISEEQRLKEADKDKQLADLHKQIEELQRKAEVASQQAQGEVQEIELESILAQQFRFDKIEPVPKGVRGADIIQQVYDETGRFCGSIIWESKRTKSWGNDWIQKLKDDQRAVKAEIAALVSSVLPKDVNRFGNSDGIWISDFPSVVGLATALRVILIQVAYASNALQGKNEKMELIYRYLCGTSFKQRVEAIVESFVSMKSDLDAEKRSMEKIWAKRDAQIDRVIKNTAGMYGELQGIIGSALPEVKILALPENSGG